MPVVARFTLAALSLIFTSSSLAGIVDLQPMALPPELRNVAIVSIHEDRGQFIIAGVANGGGCFVALLTRQLTLLALRSFPGISNDYCGFASVDPAGDILVLGISRSPDFPFTAELQPGVPSIQFVMKLSRQSLSTIFATHVGLGNVYGFAVAHDGTIWLGGWALRGLPTTPDAVWRYYFDGTFVDPRERAGFIARLSADGRKILYCSYLGGYRDAVGTLSIDRDDNVYAAGSQIWKFSGTGRLIWSTWLPPSSALGSAVGPDGSFYIVGSTDRGEKLYTTPGAFQPEPYPSQSFPLQITNRNYPVISIDGFVARLSPSGQVIYSTLMGGVGMDYLSKVIVEDDGAAIVYGYSMGRLFPTRAATALVGRGPVLAKLSPDGTSAAFSTYTPGALTSPVAFPGGGLLMFSSIYSESGTSEISAYRVTELPETLPRIDRAVNSAQPRNGLTAGTNASIAGEGFSVVTAVTIGDVPARIVSQSDCLIEIEIPATLPGLTPQAIFTGDLRLLRGSEVLQQIRVQVFALFPQ